AAGLVALAHDTRLSFFFFSSRRRHTRSKRDWSSDVCSSDLREMQAGWSLAGWSSGFSLRQLKSPAIMAPGGMLTSVTPDVALWRSEERRVGKECRSGGEGEQSR